MANRFVRTPRAKLDLIEIWEFIAEDNEPAADRMLDRMEQALAMLQDNPLAGRARPELMPEIRSHPVGNYVLFYRPIPAGIELVRVLNGYRDIQGGDLL